MIRVIALTQFVFVTLGSVAAIILVRAETVTASQIGGLQMFLAEHGLWLILIPIAWGVLAEASVAMSRKTAVARVVQASGVLLAAAILAIYGWVIVTS